MKVKICGIRTIDAAQAAVDAGADFIGFNFVSSSKRRISFDKAKEIIESINGNISTVGVFQNQELDFIQGMICDLDLDYVQLHGNEDKNFANKMNADVIKTFSLSSKSIYDQIESIKNYPAEYIMIDRVVQGNGEMVDLEKAKKLAGKFNIFLAGGLNPENISDIVSAVKPFAVDVAGGVETNGVQDLGKIKKFIFNAKGPA